MGVWRAGQLEFAFCDVKVAKFLNLQAGRVKPSYSFRELDLTQVFEQLA